MTSPDPVREAQAYQQSLLDALGDDDPAEARATTPDRIRRLIAAAGPDLRTRPAPREWSVLECIGHVTDAETVMSARYRWVLAHDEPELIGYDQDLWVDGLRHNGDDPNDLLVLFETLRAANLALWRRSSVEQRARVGRHVRKNDPEGNEFCLR